MSRTSLVKISPLQIGHVPVNSTTPQYWFKWGNVIGIHPIPDDTYNLAVYAATLPQTKMTASDYPEIQDEFVPLIIQYAHCMGLLKKKLYAQSAQVYMDYIEKCNTLRMRVIEKYANRRDDLIVPDVVVPASEGGE